MREQMGSLGPEWQKSLIPYKSLKKAIKHDELDMDAISRWDPLLSTAWSYRLDILSNLYIEIQTNHPSFEQNFYPVLCQSLITLRIFLDEAFEDTTNRLESLQNRLYSSANPFEKDFLIWKKFFSIYKDFKVWELNDASQALKIPFSTLEAQFTAFINLLQKKKLSNRLATSESKETLLLFLEANKQLLSLLRFCELNRIAASKIMKKFKKATQKQLCLENAQSNISPLYNYPKITLTLWWNLLHTLPDIEDYLCAICFDILWYPTRLSCGHYFCNYCCVRAQLRGKVHCPVCRSPGAMGSANIECKDPALSNYLKTYFPVEVKKKKKDQEMQRMIEEHSYAQGVECLAKLSCSIM